MGSSFLINVYFGGKLLHPRLLPVLATYSPNNSVYLSRCSNFATLSFLFYDWRKDLGIGRRLTDDSYPLVLTFNDEVELFFLWALRANRLFTGGDSMETEVVCSQGAVYSGEKYLVRITRLTLFVQNRYFPMLFLLSSVIGRLLGFN
jgi:hypothetical protein